jgi:hypothetical protein
MASRNSGIRPSGICVNSTVSQVPLPALFEGMRMAIQQPQPKITAKPIEFNRLKQYPISYLLLIWLFQQSPIGCGSGFSGRYRTVRSAPNRARVYVRLRDRAGFEKRPWVSGGDCDGKRTHLGKPGVARDSCRDRSRSTTVAGSQWTDQPVAPPIRAFAKVALQGLDMRNMPESHLFKR